VIGNACFHRWPNAERPLNAKTRNSAPRNFWDRVVGVHEFDRSVTERCKPFLLGDYLREARNTTVQVWTVEEGFGIGRLFRQTRCAACAANNFRDHEVLFHCSGNCASVREFGGTTRTVMKSGFRLAQESASRFVSKNRSITTAFRS
jgi:hypothetical protein